VGHCKREQTLRTGGKVMQSLTLMELLTPCQMYILLNELDVQRVRVCVCVRQRESAQSREEWGGLSAAGQKLSAG